MSNRRSVTMFRFGALLLSLFTACTSAARAESSKVVAVIGNEHGYTFVFHKEAPDNWRVVGDAIRKLHEEKDLASIAVETTGRKVCVTGICPDHRFSMNSAIRVNASQPDALYVSTVHEYIFEFEKSDEKVEGDTVKKIGAFTCCIADVEHVSMTIPIGKIIAGFTEDYSDTVIR